MATRGFLFIGSIVTIFGLIILLLTISSNSSDHEMIAEIDKSVINCNDKNAFEKARDGDLVYISGEYETMNNGVYDKDFEINFKEPIIKRTVEKYGGKYIRKLQGINEDNDFNTQIEEDQKIINPNKIRCKKKIKKIYLKI